MSPFTSHQGITKGIPKDLRDRVISDPNWMRFWLTLFSLYRVFKSPLKPKLATITDPFSGNEIFVKYFLDFLDSAYGLALIKTLTPHDELGKVHRNPNGRYFRSRLVAKEILLSNKASPNSKVSWLGILIDAKAWMLQPHDLLLEYLVLTNNFMLLDWYLACRHCVLQISSFGGLLSPRTGEYLLGKLGFKEEAAGKLRVFAMVDHWTQAALKPLHSCLSDVLKGLPNDGTFDQNASVERCKAKGTKGSYSYDLSAATDRLPINIQKGIIDRLFGVEGLGDLWARLLVERDYAITKNDYGIDPQKIRYSVGQPMGALSSWNMLALTHHLIVQWAAKLAYSYRLPEWYVSYEVLGDDIVIFNDKVAKAYLTIMRGLGLEINLSKSVISPKVASFEYAKRTVYKGVDVSGIPWKLINSNINSISTRISLVFNHWWTRGMLFTPTSLLACVLINQKDILSVLKRTENLWAKLLVERDYYTGRKS